MHSSNGIHFIDVELIGVHECMAIAKIISFLLVDAVEIISMISTPLIPYTESYGHH